MKSQQPPTRSFRLVLLFVAWAPDAVRFLLDCVIVNTWMPWLTLFAGLAVACGTAPASEPGPVIGDGAEPEGSAGGSGKADQVSIKTVAQAVLASCSTESVRGLSLQIVAQMNCSMPNALAELPERDNLGVGHAALPFAQTAALAALVSALDDNPQQKMTVNSLLRTVAQQHLLYGWYQTGRCGVPLAAKPGKSNHESGLALDTNQFEIWRAALQPRGFKWFGNADKFHFDYIGPGAESLAGLDVQAFQTLWNRNHPDDAIDVNGKYDSETAARLAESPSAGFAQGASCE